MNRAEDEEWLQTPTKQATLCFLMKDGEVLLGMKKRGFAEGRWNGFGGKPNGNEEILDTAIRETQEEAGIIPKSLIQVAVINFHHPNFGMQVVVYLAKKWEGTPIETEEMRPKWFLKDEIPYDEMWVDDIIWLPLILEGKKVRAQFRFDGNNKLLDQEIIVVESFE